MTESTQSIRAKVTTALEAAGFPFEVLDIDPSLSDTAAFCEHYGYPMSQSANAILVATKKEPRRFALCMVLATGRLDVNKKCKSLLEGRASFAAREDMERVTGMAFGAVTPFGMPSDIPIYVDSAVMACPWVIVGAGDRAAKVKVSPEAITALPQAQVEEGLATPI